MNKLKYHFLGGLVFLGTILFGYIGYTAYRTDLPTQVDGASITKDIWNNLITRVNDIGNKTSSFPVFSATLNQASSAPINTWAKVPFNAVEFDTNSNFDTTNNRFQPNQAGYYQISLTITFTGTGSGGSTSYARLYKNGLCYKWNLNLQNYNGGFWQTLNVDTDVYMNGTTDYLEAYYHWNGGTITLSQGGLQTRMSGHYLRP